MPTGLAGEVEVVIPGGSSDEGSKNNPEANAKSFLPRMVRTGDQGAQRRRRRYLHLTARSRADHRRRREKSRRWKSIEVMLRSRAWPRRCVWNAASHRGEG